MPTCCQGATCACKVSAEEGGHIVVSGSGQANDPFLISADVALDVTDNLTFDLSLTGTGVGTDPWTIGVNFSPTAKLSDFPDVADTAATNGQVLGFNTTTGLWGPTAPTTAAAGAVKTNTSLTGDGSVGTPLAVIPDANRLLGSTATGVGLSDAGMISVVRHFADAASRNTMTPAPGMNSLSMLATAPGEVDYWNGTIWAPILDRVNIIATDEFLELSGPYNGTTPITRLLNQVATTTDASGDFTILSTATLTGRAGVLTVSFQESGTTGWKAVLRATGGQVVGRAYRLTDGTAMVGTPVTGMSDAYVY